MSKDKVKLYKNAARKTSTAYQPYVPQYQLMGIEPQEYKSATLPSNARIVESNSDNPRVRQMDLQKPLEPSRQSNNYMPNVGNNMDQTWSAIDGKIIDDMEEVSLDQSLIDNNDFISEESFKSYNQAQLPEPDYAKHTIIENKTDDDLSSIVKNLESNSYLLLINDVAICSGPFEDIQEQARALVFGEHELCGGSPIPVEDLIIIKKVSIKMGLFLE